VLVAPAPLPVAPSGVTSLVPALLGPAASAPINVATWPGLGMLLHEMLMLLSTAAASCSLSLPAVGFLMPEGSLRKLPCPMLTDMDCMALWVDTDSGVLKLPLPGVWSSAPPLLV